MRSHTFLVPVCLITTVASFGANGRATITGKVVDASGKSIDHATVLVYEAGMKKGFSVYCPTC